MEFTGHEFLKAYEGKVLNKAGDHVAYQDQGGVWTIGYGHTAGVKKGQTITEAKALEFLDQDIAWAEKTVNDTLKGHFLTQNQFNALVSLTYNIGPNGFKTSTVVKRIKAKDYAGAAEAITWWNLVDGKVSQGLVARRAKEKAMFLTPDAPTLPFPTSDKDREQKIRALVDKFVKDLMEI